MSTIQDVAYKNYMGLSGTLMAYRGVNVESTMAPNGTNLWNVLRFHWNCINKEK